MNNKKSLKLIGETFGDLTVIGRIEKPENIKTDIPYWLCKCNCGNEIVVSGESLRNGFTLDCGCVRKLSLVGQKFYKLTVLRYQRKDDDYKVFWWCKCECGNEKEVSENSLLSGRTKSCGCLKTARENLVGLKFGRLTVLEMVTLKNGVKTSWICRCDCGNLLEVLGTSLKSGNTQSCGCYNLDRNYELADNLIGQKFGKLTVLELIRVRNKKGVSERYWKCICDCGNFTTVLDRSIKHGQTRSCGCLMGKSNMKAFSLASFNKLYGTYKTSAKHRKLIFDLSKEFFEKITKENCYYCGREPSQVIKSKCDNGDYIYNGIDRVDSSKGYITDNVVPCCVECNRAKLDTPLPDFVLWIEKVYNHIIKKEEINI